MGVNGRKPISDSDKLIELLTKGIKSGDCLICHLAPNAKGYSNLSTGGRTGKKQRAHRFVFEQINGKLPDTVMVLHTCDNRRCIEINHLYAGDAQQNTDDMMEKLRGSNQYRLGYSRRYS